MKTALAERALAAITRHRSVRVVDDVAKEASGGYQGSFLWHGLPLTPDVLATFSELECPPAQVVVGVVSSGLPWATALAIARGLPLVPLRLAPHRYGVWNQGLDELAGASALLVDNYVGSGETMAAARAMVEARGVRVEAVLAAEGLARHDHLSLLLATEWKLTQLLKRGYFTEIEAEVARRFLDFGPERWLADAPWVERIKASGVGGRSRPRHPLG